MDDPTQLVDDYLRREADAERLTLLGSSGGTWDVLLPSNWKETLAVSISLGDWHLRAEAFFLRAPEENPDRAYRLLLQRNERGGAWRFCVNDAGDVSLVALVPRGSVTGEELDRLLGTAITMTDETYVPYMKLAFEKGLEEQVRKGGPGLDKPPPWAR